jgi:hypothetical protein
LLQSKVRKASAPCVASSCRGRLGRLAHTVRGVISGALEKKSLGHVITADTIAGRRRVYRIEPPPVSADFTFESPP